MINIMEFLNIYISRLKSLGINEFNKEILKMQLNYFKEDKLFIDLFKNYDEEDLEESIEILKLIGYLYSFKSNEDIVYIIKIEKELEGNNTLNMMIDKCCNIKKISKNYKNLNILLTNPNKNFTFMEASFNDNIITSKLYSDGEIFLNNIKLIKGEKTIFLNYEDYIKLNNISYKRCNVEGASYLIQEMLVNDIVKMTNLYTNITDKNEINKILKKVS